MTATLTTDADLLAAYNTARDAYEEAHDKAARAAMGLADGRAILFDRHHIIHVRECGEDMACAYDVLIAAETAALAAGLAVDVPLGGKHRRVA